MSSIPLETGSLVHDTIAAILERLLVSSSEIDGDRFTRFVREKVSRACLEREFSEVYYGERDSIDQEDLLPGVMECLETFLSSERFGWIREKALNDPGGWLIEPPGYGETRIDGMKAYCKVDFLFVVDGRVTILDWKTGRRHEGRHLRQLLGYTCWAVGHLGVDPLDTDPVVAYLRPSYEELPLRPSRESVALFVETVRAETGEMYGYCSNIPRNLPIEKEGFPLVEEGSSLCGFCNFRELCGRA